MMDVKICQRNRKSIFRRRVRRCLFSTGSRRITRAANAIDLLDQISQDPNMPMYTRTRIWNVISVLEGIRD
jgi:uncharacterized protein (UPF0147 family)